MTHAAARSVNLGPALGFGGALGKHASSRLSKKTCLSGIGPWAQDVRKGQTQTLPSGDSTFDLAVASFRQVEQLLVLRKPRFHFLHKPR